MEGLPFGSLVNPSVRIVCVRAGIADMSQNMAHRVLGSCRSKMRADTAENGGGDFLTIICDRKPAYHLKTDAVDQRFPELRKVVAEKRQREFFFCDRSDFLSRGEE